MINLKLAKQAISTIFLHFFECEVNYFYSEYRAHSFHIISTPFRYISNKANVEIVLVRHNTVIKVGNTMLSVFFLLSSQNTLE